jgi:hypothetical protein
MANKYIDTLKADFTQMGILDNPEDYPGDEPEFVIDDYESLGDLVAGSTYELTPSELNREGAVTTVLAKRIRNVPEDLYFESPGWGCCSAAEALLVKNISQREVEDDSRPSPVLLVDADRVLAVLKRSGEMTAYALVDDPKSKLVAGTFFSVMSPEEIINSALNTVSDDTIYKVNLNDLPDISPIRFSFLVTPVRARRNLYHGHMAEYYALNTSHQAVKQRAAQLAGSATLLHL